jgi:ArsR family transcriptional regulator
MDKATAIQALGALAHPIRLDVFRALVAAGPTGLTPGLLIESLEVPSAKLSFHLKELAIAGLVTQEQLGRYVIYRAAYDQMNGLLGYLTENCCEGVSVAETADSGVCSAC